MATAITTLLQKQTEADNPDVTLNAVASDRYGDVMVSVRLDFEDGHSSIATMTVTHGNVLIAADVDVKLV